MAHPDMRIFLSAFAIVIVALTTFPISAQSDWKTLRNSEYKFRFLYPPDWTVATPRGPNVRASINAPNGPLMANCNVVILDVPQLGQHSQKELNNAISTEPFSKQDWLEMLGDKFSDIKIIESKTVKVDNQPAYFSIATFSYEVLAAKVWAQNMNLVTYRPRQTWNFTCAAGGATPEDMRKSFEHWQSILSRILSSIVFEN